MSQVAKGFTYALLVVTLPLKGLAYTLGVICGTVVDGFTYGFKYDENLED